MNKLKRKPILLKLLNVEVAFAYFSHAFHIILQGYTIKDKIILLIHYFKSPIILFKSIFKNMEIRDVEEQYKILASGVTLSNKNGIFFCGNNLLSVYIADDNYQKNFGEYMRLTEGVFIDVGAHIGKYSIEIGKKIKGHVIAVEPEKNNFSSLRKNILLNKLTNVIAVNKCMYSNRGEVTFYTSDIAGEGEHSLLKRPGLTREETVSSDTLDNVIKELNLNRADLIKIDVEGAECDVLKGAHEILKNFHPGLVIEVWNEDALKRVKEILSAYHYKTPVRIDEMNYFFE